MAALGMERLGPRTRAVFDGLFAAAIVVPGVVIGIATLVALVAVFSFINPALGRGLAGRKATAARPRLWLDHRRARPVLDGAGDDDRQGAHRQPRPRHRRGLQRSLCDTAHHIPLDRAAADHAVDPGGLPARLHLLLRRFHHRLLRRRLEDDLPIYVFASIRRGVTPEINAVATLVLVASLMLILIARILMREKKPTN